MYNEKVNSNGTIPWDGNDWRGSLTVVVRFCKLLMNQR